MIMKTNHNHKPSQNLITNNITENSQDNSNMGDKSETFTTSTYSSSSNYKTENQYQHSSQIEKSNNQSHTCQSLNSNNTISSNVNLTSSSSAFIPTKLYVTNFPYTCTQRQIQDLFSKYGQVVECTLKKDYYAYILFSSIKSALNAFKTANGSKMYGRKLTVHLATSKKSQSHLNHATITNLNQILDDIENLIEANYPDLPKIIHVRNFPENCSQQQVRDLFTQYGDILDCLILHDSYAFVHFKSALDARLALQSTNNLPFMSSSSNLLVQYSRSKFKQQNSTSLNQNDMNCNMNRPVGIQPNSSRLNGPNQINTFKPVPSSINKSENENESSLASINETNDDYIEVYRNVDYDSNDDDYESEYDSKHRSSSLNCNQQSYNEINYKTNSNFPKSNNTLTNKSSYQAISNEEINRNLETTNSTAPIIRTKLYVTNFPEDMDQDEMKQLFNQYGQVLECTIMWNQYAFVHFGSYAEAEKALNGIKGSQYKGYKISVQWSTSSKYQQPKQSNHSKVNTLQINNENTILTTKILERSNKSSILSNSNINSIDMPKQNLINNDKSENNSKSFNDNINTTINTSNALSGVDSQDVNSAIKMNQTQSWASIMNNNKSNLTEKEQVSINTSNNTTTKPISNNKSQSQLNGPFKVSFSEIVRSSATNSTSLMNLQNSNQASNIKPINRTVNNTNSLSVKSPCDTTFLNKPNQSNSNKSQTQESSPCLNVNNNKNMDSKSENLIINESQTNQKNNQAAFDSKLSPVSSNTSILNQTNSSNKANSSIAKVVPIICKAKNTVSEVEITQTSVTYPESANVINLSQEKSQDIHSKDKDVTIDKFENQLEESTLNEKKDERNEIIDLAANKLSSVSPAPSVKNINSYVGPIGSLSRTKTNSSNNKCQTEVILATNIINNDIFSSNNQQNLVVSQTHQTINNTEKINNFNAPNLNQTISNSFNNKNNSCNNVLNQRPNLNNNNNNNNNNNISNNFIVKRNNLSQQPPLLPQPSHHPMISHQQHQQTNQQQQSNVSSILPVTSGIILESSNLPGSNNTHINSFVTSNASNNHLQSVNPQNNLSLYNGSLGPNLVNNNGLVNGINNPVINTTLIHPNNLVTNHTYNNQYQLNIPTHHQYHSNNSQIDSSLYNGTAHSTNINPQISSQQGLFNIDVYQAYENQNYVHHHQQSSQYNTNSHHNSAQHASIHSAGSQLHPNSLYHIQSQASNQTIQMHHHNHYGHQFQNVNNTIGSNLLNGHTTILPQSTPTTHHNMNPFLPNSIPHGSVQQNFNGHHQIIPLHQTGHINHSNTTQCLWSETNQNHINNLSLNEPLYNSNNNLNVPKNNDIDIYSLGNQNNNYNEVNQPTHQVSKQPTIHQQTSSVFQNSNHAYINNSNVQNITYNHTNFQDHSNENGKILRDQQPSQPNSTLSSNIKFNINSSTSSSNDYTQNLLIQQSPSNQGAAPNAGTTLLTNAFVNLTVTSASTSSSSTGSSSCSSSSSSTANNFMLNGGNNSLSSDGSSSSSTPSGLPNSNSTNSAIAKPTTPTSISSNPSSIISGKKLETNGLVSVFNSYVLFPSDSFDLSNEQLLTDENSLKNIEGTEEQDHQSINNHQNSTFYPIEDVLANLIR